MVAKDLHDRLIVSSPDWNDGQPVRVQHAHPAGPASMTVLWQDVRGHGGVHADEVPIGMQLTLISGGCVRGQQ